MDLNVRSLSVGLFFCNYSILITCCINKMTSDNISKTTLSFIKHGPPSVQKACRRWFLWKHVVLLVPLLSDISLILLIFADPRFLWHRHAIWNASCSQHAHTQVPTRGPPRHVSQVACLVLL